ncbi:MAG: metallophosphoesterase [Armatimonadota bacterium]|nr:metallophosphoesterase [Armatimonadota bacterium]
MSVKIAAIADVHYKSGDVAACGRRRSAIADILLLRAVHRLNRWVKPDVTILLGDFIDDPASPNALDDLRRVKQVADLLQSPLIAIPGNHDPDVDTFYTVFEYPGQVVDVKGVRFVLFFDPAEPKHNARRTDAGLRWMASACEGHLGPTVSVQHVPLFPPGTSDSPFAYTNAKDVWSVFAKCGYTLALSGHYHDGDNILSRGAAPSVVVPALCESPFQFAEITIDSSNVQARFHQLALSRELGLMDCHVHTPFAYCQENMDMALSLVLAEDLGLAGLAFTEHSGQLYFDDKTFWSAAFMPTGIDTDQGKVNRMPQFLEQARKFCPPAVLGLEIDCDYLGRPVVRPDDLAQVELRLGSIHWLEALMKPEPDTLRAGDEMIARLERFLPSGIDILAHPFRAFGRKKTDVPSDLMPRLVKLLRQHNVAAEINFHTQETGEDFVTACLNEGVKLAFGSDSHNLYEVGELQPHLDLLARCGVPSSRLKEVLVDLSVFSDARSGEKGAKGVSVDRSVGITSC